MTVLSLKAKHDHLVKVASTRDHIKALSEFVWNALDADATDISVNLERNPFGGLQSITIKDNGSGISKARADIAFESLGESWKRKTNRTLSRSRAMHGKEGQGRLRFYSVAEKAVWSTCYVHDSKHLSIVIEIDGARLANSLVSEPEINFANKETGTVVNLGPLRETFDWLTSRDAKAEFSSIFAPYVLQYPDVKITYDEELVDPSLTIERSHSFPSVPLVCPNRTVRDLVVKVIEWKSNAEGRKIYFGGEAGVVLGSQAAYVTAPGINFSIYAYSKFFEELSQANLLEIEGLADEDFSRVLEFVRGKATDYFRERQAEASGELIQRLMDDGVYPYEGDPKDEVEKRERQVFDIATHAVSSYSGDFKKADNSLKKITLRLLKEAMKRNPDSVSNILTAVFNLPKNKQDDFSSLLEKTELGNIISASSLIADRFVVLEVLKEMVFNPKHRTSIKERGELDVLIRDNTWLFGENFHFTLAEAGLTKVMNRVSDQLALGRKHVKVRKPDGKIGRIDAFMGRELPTGSKAKREFLLIELKKPSIKVGRKELDQLEDYVNSMLQQPDFVTNSTSWNFFLVTTEYDAVVAERITQEDRPSGLWIDKPNHKVWVKTWSEIILDCEARISFVQEKLKIEVSGEDIENRIAHLKKSILKIDTNDSSALSKEAL